MFNHLIQMHIKDKRMFNPNPVTQEFFGVLTKDKQGSYGLDSQGQFNTDNKDIVLVLESPHRSEYNKGNGSAIKSANGKTGDKIEKQLSPKINDMLINNQILIDQAYNVYAVNAIQYQCSCGLKPIQTELRNSIFRMLWPSLKEDFINRIKQLNPVLIINMCTGGVSSISDHIKKTASVANVNDYIKRLLSKELPLNLLVHMSLIDYIGTNRNINYFYCVHPSSRSFSKCSLHKV